VAEFWQNLGCWVSYINPEFQNIQNESGLRLVALTFEHLKTPSFFADQQEISQTIAEKNYLLTLKL
jgi:hypothetical protein